MTSFWSSASSSAAALASASASSLARSASANLDSSLDTVAASFSFAFVSFDMAEMSSSVLTGVDAPGAVDAGSFGLAGGSSKGSNPPSSLPSQPSFQPSSDPPSDPGLAFFLPASPLTVFLSPASSATLRRVISSRADSSSTLLAPSSVCLARSAAWVLATEASSDSLRLTSSLPISFSSSDRRRSISSDSAIFSLRCAAMTSAMSPSSYHFSFLALATGSLT